MTFSAPGPQNREVGNINLAGQKPGRDDDDTDDTGDPAGQPEASSDATTSRPSARRRRRSGDTDAEKTAERDEGSADMPSEKTDAESDAQDAPVEAKKANDEVAAAPAPPELPSMINTVPPAQSSGAHGLFGVSGSGDTSGFSGLSRSAGFGIPFESSPRPYGGWFDEVADSLAAAYPGWTGAHLATLVDRGEITFYVKKEHIARVCQVLRDDTALRFELLASVSGVDYLRPEDAVTSTADPRVTAYAAQRLHVVYHLLSLTYRRRIRVEVATTVEDPHVPSVSKVYPTADWQEREAYDMFGIIFDGHQALTRILMPDDWEGFPQRKDYPLGGIPVEYKGASIPPPDERRAYR